MSHQKLFTDFKAVSRAEWLEKIAKDLKGRPLSDLDWKLDPLSISPFAHAEDLDGTPEAIVKPYQTGNNWEISEQITVIDGNFEAANSQALLGLMGGVTAPCFMFDTFPMENQLDILIKDIELDYIQIYFKEKTGNSSPLNFLKTMQKVVEKQGKNTQLLRGGVFYDPFADGRFDTVSLLKTVEFAAQNFPKWRVISVDTHRFFKTADNVVEALANSLAAGEAYLKTLKTAQLRIDNFNNIINFQIPIGLHYFLEIAQLRAFKLLWGNLLESYNMTPMPPYIIASTVPQTAMIAPDMLKIQTTTQAMSAVLGGADMLTIEPTENNDFGRRIARNISHLLMMESYLDKVIDPAAGSYYIEKLTFELAEKAWKMFNTSK